MRGTLLSADHSSCRSVFMQQSFEHRKLAVDLAEVILKWELQRIKDDQEQPTNTEVTQLGLRPRTVLSSYDTAHGFSQYRPS